MAGAEAIMTKLCKHKLEKFGGHIVITKHFARSLLSRMGFVKRKGTKSVKTLPSDFEDIKSKFVEKVNSVVKKYNVPDTLVLNWDQTGCQMVPGGEWTMDLKGSNQVSISGLDDKRQITVLLAVTKSGEMLPPQVIYAGKTERCLPKVDFPPEWDIYYTESHWSNEDSMLRFVKKVVIPYVNKIRELLPLVQVNQTAIALFDVYKAHRGETLLSLLKENGIIPLFIPAACTDKLQPLDLSVNYDYKEELKSHFHDWYASQIVNQVGDDHGDVSTVVVDMKTSTIKPIHAKWLIETHENISIKTGVIQTGFRKAGLL